MNSAVYPSITAAAPTDAAAGGPDAEPTGTPAPYGRACSNCSRAKCRCIYRLDGNGCERCHRLKKDCRPSVPVRRRGAAAKKATTGLSRTAQLEQKLDGLVELLAAQNTLNGSSKKTSDRGAALQAANADGAHRYNLSNTNYFTPDDGNLVPAASSSDSSNSPDADASRAREGSVDAATKPLGGLSLHLPQTPDSSSPESAPIADTNAINHMCPSLYRPDTASAAEQELHLDPFIEPTEAEADRNLTRFRVSMLPYFPLVHIPEHVPAAHLRRARPVLWLAINAVACQDTTAEVQFGRSSHLRKLFAQRLMVDCQKTMDLLQALLVFMAWIHYAARREKPTLSIMSQVAISLVYDLGLHKMGTPCRALVSRFVRYQYPHQDQDPAMPPAPLEDRRAALACYLWTSVLSISLRRIDALRWTPRMEEHLTTLDADAETPLDKILVAQVRLQRIAEQMHHGDWQLSDPSVIAANNTQGYRVGAEQRLIPPYVVQVLRSKIDEVKDSMPEEIRYSNGVLGTLHTVETMLYASAIIPVSAPMTAASAKKNSRGRNSATNLSSNVEFGRMGSLERCIESIATFWQFFQHIPNTEFSALPFAFFAYFTHCIMLLYALSMVDDPAWDRVAIRDRLHVVELLDGFAAKLRSVPSTFPAMSATVESHDVFQRASKMVAAVRDRWSRDLGRRAKAGPGTGSGSGSAGGVAPATPAAMVSATPSTGIASAASTLGSDLSSLPLDPMISEVTMQGEVVDVNGGSTAATAAAAAAGSAPDIWVGADGLPPDAPRPMEMDSMFSSLPDTFFPDLLQAMGMSEDYMFWDAYTPSNDCPMSFQ